MNMIEKIVGLVPTVSGYAKAARDFVTSSKGKVVLAAVLALAVVWYAHHAGVKSQAPKIASIEQKLAAANAELAEARNLASEIKADADVTHSRADTLQGRLKSQEAVSGQLNKKVEDYAREIAAGKKRPACVATPADVRGLQRIQ
jgi:septal ring factor EnvC (AmiA/AmiB activator)